MMKKLILLITALTTILSAQSFEGISPGLAGNYSAMSRGVNALAWNPANLALPRGNTMELNLISVNTQFYNNSFSLNSYNRYFTAEGNKGNWSISDRNELLDLISANGLRFDADVNVNILGLAFNNFGMAVQMIGQGYSKLNADKTPYKIYFFGDKLDNDYTYNQTSQVQASVYSAMKISLGYAFPFKMKWLMPELKDVAVGLSWNRYVGFGTGQTQKSDLLFQRIPGDEESVKYAVLMEGRAAFSESGSPVGVGQGFDFGISGGYGRRLDFSWSFSNIGASINWTNGTQKFTMYQADSLSVADMNSGTESSTEISVDTTYNAGSFATALPAVMRMGAVYRMSPKWKISADYHQGLNRAYGNSLRMRFGVGTEYYLLNWLPLRSGIAFGGREGSQVGLGFGLHLSVFHLDYSLAIKGALWPTYAKGIFNALSIKLVF